LRVKVAIFLRYFTPAHFPSLTLSTYPVLLPRLIAPSYCPQVDAEAQQLVLRTTNKKYFRRWSVDALRRRGLALDATALQLAHEGTTLCIRYRKPLPEVEAEALREKELLEMLKVRDPGR